MFWPITVLGIFMMGMIHMGELSLVIDDSRYIVKVETINLNEYYKIPVITNLTHFQLSCGYEDSCLRGTCYYNSPNPLDTQIPAVTVKIVL